MTKKKPTKEDKARIKSVLASLKETSILLQGSKNKIIVKVSIVATTIIAGINLLIELI